ncbi:hypothetical protein EYB25_001800 [Talaromyces marneffei]|nr:hypothetical protein EYB25_001800 [Talaromyces marneffei]
MRFTDISLVLALSTAAIAAPHPDGEKTLYKVDQSPRYILARGSDEKVLHKGSASQLVARQSSGNTGSAGNSDTCYDRPNQHLLKWLRQRQQLWR